MEKKRSKWIKALLAGGTLIALTGFAVCKFSSAAKQEVLNDMSAVADERAQLIRNYVQDAEQTLLHYSTAPEITELLAAPDNKALSEAAQQFTEEYSGEIENLEGIYVSNYETRCLAHTKRMCVGIITRSDQSTREKLHEALEEAGKGIYNDGIRLSPVSGTQVLAMYQVIYDEAGNPIGFTGFALHTDQLKENLNRFSISGIKKSSCTMLNVNDAKYIFSNDSDLIGKETENDTICTLCSDLLQNTAPERGTIQYKTDSGKYLSSYTYMPEYGWLLMIDARI